MVGPSPRRRPTALRKAYLCVAKRAQSQKELSDNVRASKALSKSAETHPEMYFSKFNGMMIKSRGGSVAGIFAYVINPGENDALEEVHSRIKRTIATSVGRREKWRTLWRRGVMTRPGRL